MSYKTNPIANRLKIIKGWKTPYFPTKTINYTRDIVLWFKVYLLLKTYLNLKNIKLLSCEIRLSENNAKILYLSINKFWNAKKEKQRKQSSLKKLHSPLIKTKNTNAVFFLYQNLQFLKQTSILQHNFLRKKITSPFWLNKPRISSWLNTIQSNKLIRSQTVQNRVVIQNWKKKQLLHLKNNKIFFPKLKLQPRLLIQKQKKILAISARLKNKINLLERNLFLLSTQKKSDTTKKTIQNLVLTIKENQVLLKKIKKLYNFLWTKNKSFHKKKSSFLLKKFLSIRSKKLLNLIWFKIKKNFNSLSRTRLIRSEFPTLLVQIQDFLFKKTYPYRWIFAGNSQPLKNILCLTLLLKKLNAFRLNTRKAVLQNYRLKAHLNQFVNLEKGANVSLLKKEQANLFSNNDLKKNHKFKSLIRNNLTQKANKILIRDRKSASIPFEFQIWKLMRWKKKESKRNDELQGRSISLALENAQRKSATKIIPFIQRYKKSRKSINKLVSSKGKRSDVFKHYQYRVPYRKNYQTNVTLMTNFRVKYLIQDFIQKKFFVHVDVKFIRPLQLKNLKFYRLVFPIWKTNLSQKLKKEKNEKLHHKYVYLARGFKIKTNSKLNIKESTKNLSKIKKKLLPKILTRTWNFSKKLQLKRNKNLQISFKTKLQKENPYLLSKKSKKESRTSSSFQQFQKQRHMQNFIATLIIFSQTLDPQPLADHLAKVMEKTKKHTWMLNTVHQMMKSINFNRAIGYRIGFFGRINSADKSRLIYLTRKSVPQQGFAKNINFAVSQARARIGTFGIKIWVYY